MAYEEISNLTELRAETFAFATDEATRIYTLIQEDTTDLTSNRSKEQNIRQLLYLSKKQINQRLHASTMIKYHRVQRIPQGLRIPLKPSLCKNVQRFKDRWFAILNKCSLDLILLIIEELSNILEALTTEITTIKTELDKSMTAEKWAKTLEDINNQLQQHTQEVNERKIRKFCRDTLDYKLGEVYTWADIYAKRRQNKPQSLNTDTSSSESDTSYHSRTTHVPTTSTTSTTLAISSTSTGVCFLGVGPTDQDDPGGAKEGNKDKEREQPQTRTITAKKDKSKKGGH